MFSQRRRVLCVPRLGSKERKSGETLLKKKRRRKPLSEKRSRSKNGQRQNLKISPAYRAFPARWEESSKREIGVAAVTGGEAVGKRGFIN